MAIALVEISFRAAGYYHLVLKVRKQIALGLLDLIESVFKDELLQRLFLLSVLNLLHVEELQVGFPSFDGGLVIDFEGVAFEVDLHDYKRVFNDPSLFELLAY